MQFSEGESMFQVPTNAPFKDQNCSFPETKLLLKNMLPRRNNIPF
jgi:hypothetical protein